MHQKRNVITRHIQITRINFSHVRQSVEILDLWAIRIVQDLAILPIRGAKNLVQRFALGKLYDRIVELAPAYKIDRRAFIQRLLRRRSHRRPNKRYLDARISRFNRLCQPLITLPPGRAGKEHEKFIVLADPDGFVCRDVMRRGVQQPRAFQHSSRICQPDRIPI